MQSNTSDINPTLRTQLVSCFTHDYCNALTTRRLSILTANQVAQTHTVYRVPDLSRTKSNAYQI